MTLLLLISTLFIHLQLNANNPDWNAGVLVTNHQEVINGDIKYNPKFELVQLKVDGKIRTLSPASVQQFMFYDQQKDLHRRFITIKIEANPTKHEPGFYELIFSGEFSLIRKHNKINSPNTSFLPSNNLESYEARLLHDQVIGFDYYVEYHHQFIPLEKFRKSIWPLMQSDESMQQFISNNKLSPHKKGDQVKMLKHYNRILKIQNTKITRANR